MNEVCDRKDFNDPALPRGVAEFIKEADGEEVAAGVAAEGAAPQGLLLHRPQPAAALARAAVGTQAPVAQARPDRQPELPHVLHRTPVRRPAPGRRVLREDRPQVSAEPGALRHLRRPGGKTDGGVEIRVHRLRHASRARFRKERAPRGTSSRSRTTTASSATTPTCSRSIGWTVPSMEVGNEEGSHGPHDPRPPRSPRGSPGRTRRPRGALPIQAIGHYGPHNAICSDFEPGNTVYPQQWFVEKKEPWPTLTGRQQFLPRPGVVHRNRGGAAGAQGAADGGRSTIRCGSPAATRAGRSTPSGAISANMLRLQRGQPVMYMNMDDAEKRDIKDQYDYVRVYNDVGSFHIHVKPSPPALQPGQVVIYHAWENVPVQGLDPEPGGGAVAVEAAARLVAATAISTTGCSPTPPATAPGERRWRSSAPERARARSPEFRGCLKPCPRPCPCPSLDRPRGRARARARIRDVPFVNAIPELRHVPAPYRTLGRETETR